MDKDYALKSSVRLGSYFGENSGAYPFTNEPLSDLSSMDLNFEGSSLVITSTGDIQILIAGLGAKNIDSLDISRKSTAWADYKLQIFLNNSKQEFLRILLETPFWREFPMDLPVLEDSRRIFVENRGQDWENIYRSRIFKQVKFSALRVDSLPYLRGDYENFRGKLKQASIKFHLGSLEHLLKIPTLDKKFSFVYLSNALDHTFNDDGKSYDFSKNRLIRVLEPIITCLDQAGQIIYNFAWSGRAIQGSTEALKHFGHSLKRIEKKSEGCGEMYVSEKTKRLT